jgi:type II secretory pathway component PulF
LPDPALIYQRARLQSQQKAIRLALRPIRIMTVVAFVVFACSPWLGFVLPFSKELSASWSRSLDSTLAFVSKSWPVMPNQPVILLASFGTIILLALSSWYMLREE